MKSVMKPLPHNAELLGVAERTVWYKPPDQAIADQPNFVAHVLTYGDQDDVKALRRYLSLDDIRELLDHAPAGVFDERSWSYWNAMVGRFPAPPMPRRIIPD
jgi:hypothetical protein